MTNSVRENDDNVKRALLKTFQANDLVPHSFDLDNYLGIVRETYKQVYGTERYLEGFLFNIYRPYGSATDLFAEAEYRAIAEAFNPEVEFTPVFKLFCEWIEKSYDELRSEQFERWELWYAMARRVVDAIEGVMRVFNEKESAAREIVIDAWERYEQHTVRDNLPVGIHKRFGFLLSLGCVNWYEGSYGCISASYFTDTRPYFYMDREVGWVFDMNFDNVICMSSCDSSSCCRNGRDYFLAHAFRDSWGRNESITIENAQPYKVRPVLTPEQLLAGNDCNEVILKGNAKPAAVL